MTDVYSYGILMWEVFSNGQVPYPGMTVVQVYEEVKSGYRMQPPTRMPTEVTEIMKRCWSENPEKRFDFATTASELDVIYKHLKKNHHLLIIFY